MAAQRIACLSLLPDAVAGVERAVILGREYEWETIPCEQQLETVRDRLPELAASHDGVALDGVASSFRFGDKLHRHEFIWNMLRLEDYGDRVTDGTSLQATLERYMVKLAADQLGAELRGKRMLFLSGLTRAGAAEVLAGYTRRMVFGDLLYGWRLGIPIIGYKHFVAAAPGLINAISHTPAQWFWPQVRSSQSPLPRFHQFFHRADVVVGDLIYFARYAPDSLSGKVIFSTLRRPEDVEMLRLRGAGKVVSLTPVVEGTFVPLAVLEAALRHDARERFKGKADPFVDQLQEMELSPFVFDFAAAAGPDLTLAELPRTPQEPVRPLPVEKATLAPSEEVGKFAFVIHPLHFRHVQRLKTVRMLCRVLPKRAVEDIIAQAAPFVVGKLTNVVSASGAKAEGLIYAVPMTSKAIMRFPPEFLYRKLLTVAGDAAEKGCGVMGLGAYTSVVGDAGLTVSQTSPIGVTSGNSFTVAATLKTLRVAAERSGIDLASASALVVGATGSIGSICSRLLACDVAELYLVSPRPEKLLALARQITEECPQIKGRLHLSRIAADFLPRADVIISTTSAVDPIIDVASLRPGCVVCDVARPPDIKPEAAASRDDILVIESGEIRLPEGAELSYDIGLPPGTIYACLAETLLLGLERHTGHYTLGREIDPQRVQEIAAIGEKHGLELADIRSFGAVVPPERYERLRELNAARFGSVTPPSAPVPAVTSA